MIDENILREEDLDIHYQDTQRNLFTRKTAMIEDSVLITKTANIYADTDDVFALMPLFNREPQTDWARIYMTCYIGLNKHLQEEGQEEKYKKVLEIIDYISTTEGQTALSSGNGAMYFSLKEAQAPQDEIIEALIPALQEGRYGIFPSFIRGCDELREGLAKLIRKEINTDQLATMIDESNEQDTEKKTVEVYGKASENFSLMDTGSFFCDVMREEVKSDIALFLDNGKDGAYNGKGIGAKIYKGDITQTDIDRVFPDLMHGEKGELWKVDMRGKDLLTTLEYAMEINDRSGYFYYTSGLNITFNPFAKPGKRMIKVETSDGSPIKKDKVYSVAIMDESVPSQYIIQCDQSGLSIKNLLIEKIKEEKVIKPANDQRLIIQTNE